MAKQSGLLWARAQIAGGNDISPDVTNVDFSTPRNTQEITGMDKAAMERLLLLSDYSSTWNGVFNNGPNPNPPLTPATEHSHGRLRMVSLAGGLKGTQVLGISNTENRTAIATLTIDEVIVTDYQLTRAASGELTWSAPCMLSNGELPEWS